jgi:phage tail sheath gpL-like
MPISFNEIPANTRVPFFATEFNPAKARTATSGQRYRGLVFAPMLVTGTATANLPTLLSKGQEDLFLGQGSIGARMMKAWFAQNETTEVWVMPIADNGAGAQATGKFQLSGPATKNGTLFLDLAGMKVEVGVLAGDSISTMATAIVAALTADFPLTAATSGTAGEVNFTCRHKGTLGNLMQLLFNTEAGQQLPAGVGIVVTAMAGGATDPDLTAAIAALGDVQYHVVPTPWADSTRLGAIETELTSRFAAMRAIEGHAFIMKDDTLGNLASFGTGRNSKNVSCLGFKNSPSPAYEWAAEFAAIAAFYLEQSVVRPLKSVPFKHCRPPKHTDRFQFSERDTLLHDGISTAYVDDAGVARLERPITMNQKNDLGAPDDTWLDINVPFFAGRLRFDWNNRCALKFPRFNLVEDGFQYDSGLAITTPNGLKKELIAQFIAWRALGFVQNIDQFKSDLEAEIDGTNPNRALLSFSPDRIKLLLQVASQMAFK